MGRKYDYCGIWVGCSQQVNRKAHRRETSVCDELADAHSEVGRHRTQALVHRKHALGTGRQFPARQDQTTYEQGCAQSRHNTQNNLLCVLHLEKASKKEGRQEKRNGRDYETHLCKFYETHQLFMPKMKKMRFWQKDKSFIHNIKHYPTR